jgi:hypothetical protein
LVTSKFIEVEAQLLSFKSLGSECGEKSKNTEAETTALDGSKELCSQISLENTELNQMKSYMETKSKVFSEAISKKLSMESLCFKGISKDSFWENCQEIKMEKHSDSFGFCVS